MTCTYFARLSPSARMTDNFIFQGAFYVGHTLSPILPCSRGSRCNAHCAGSH